MVIDYRSNFNSSVHATSPDEPGRRLLHHAEQPKQDRSLWKERRFHHVARNYSNIRRACGYMDDHRMDGAGHAEGRGWVDRSRAREGDIDGRYFAGEKRFLFFKKKLGGENTTNIWRFILARHWRISRALRQVSRRSILSKPVRRCERFKKTCFVDMILFLKKSILAIVAETSIPARLLSGWRISDYYPTVSLFALASIIRNLQ